MLDCYSNTNLKINSVSGTLVKNYKDSFFEKFSLKSPFADTVLSPNPYMIKTDKYGNRKETPVIILQCLVCGDIAICEIMWKEDFDKIFEKDSV